MEWFAEAWPFLVILVRVIGYPCRVRTKDFFVVVSVAGKTPDVGV